MNTPESDMEQMKLARELVICYQEKRVGEVRVHRETRSYG